MNDLHPTLWRTCRVLANKRRLACLRAVLSAPGLTVEEVAGHTGLPADQASLCLRALQARGLIQAERVSRWVRYHPVPDSSVPVAPPLLCAMRRALLSDGLPDRSVIEALTAFTHPRRLTILKQLHLDVALTATSLARQTGISLPALWRHLNKLNRRGLITESNPGWQLSDTPAPLAQTLLALIACSHP